MKKKPIPEDAHQVLYVYCNVICAMRRKNQSYLSSKTCMENQFLHFPKNC